MKLLILGGTKFVGRHLTQSALDAGHEVSLFNRGQSNPELFPDIEKLVGDRDGGLAALEGRRWDAVIDVNGYVPRVVRDSAELLKGHTDYYLFVSSMSVYADLSQLLDEESPVIELDDPSVEEITAETYGGLKVLCERVVQETYGEKACIVRPSYVIGPHDHSDRFPYWVWRASRGGELIAPGGPDECVAAIDARDMGAWMVAFAERQQSGVYNGLDAPFRFGELLEMTAQIAGVEIDAQWVSVAFAEAQDLFGPKLPLWAPGEEYIGFSQSGNHKAVASGLQCRPLKETVADTLDWIREREAAGHKWQTGIPADEEAELIAAWKTS